MVDAAAAATGAAVAAVSAGAAIWSMSAAAALLAGPGLVVVVVVHV